MVKCIDFKGVNLIVIISIAVLTGCASYSRIDNEPFRLCVQNDCLTEQIPKFRDYGDIVVLLSFSGGGTRAAAFSYGVLEELRDTEIRVRGKTKRLLDEVDHISSVSGGSFTAAYYGLFGDRIFDDYEKIFLKQNVQKILIHSFLNPLNWFKLIASGFDRSSLAIEHYNQFIFRKKTFDDMLSRGGPYIQINATDLGTGQHFEFTSEMFSLLCSDIRRFKVARAVAASSAVPVAFAPITLKNYTGCELQTQVYIDELKKKHVNNQRILNILKHLESYNNKGHRKYIHLVDGGIADNLGIRSLANHLTILDNSINISMASNEVKPLYIVILVVNAETNPERQIELSAEDPGISEVVSAVTDIQLHRYNLETISRIKGMLRKTADSISDSGREVKPYFIELKFDDIHDTKIRRFFNNIATSFAISSKQVKMLRTAGRRLLKQSIDYKKLLYDINRSSQ